MVAMELRARSGSVELAGTLWPPDSTPVALVVMHPGSGPSDRDNDVLFPPIREALAAAGIAVASFDKRGVGGSGGSWLHAGIEEQAGDLLAALSAAREPLPPVPAGVFGHSQGGWVALEAARLGGPEFVVTSSGPAVTVGEQERFSARGSAPAEVAAIDELLALAEAGASHASVSEWLAASDHARGVRRLIGDEPPSADLWGLLVRLAGYDPAPALRAVTVPLLAVFGADDDITPVDASVAALRSAVDPALLRIAVLPGGGHRLAAPGSTRFVPGYPDVVIDFVRSMSPGSRRQDPQQSSPPRPTPERPFRP
ncbi:alpha/beta hydrolase [Galbitalea sp. SE-J8]|uniref:alpha/beta hydrolase family protein n=1 Tax=Galbitalea sp. SE-J8 TaxID=3054952 RepID=UPI00259CCA4A|nr:alpha/beta hydrolase [Galbitalea sp. SE-J8]MDM4761717.1 alpha/beta hydrolase [Galbitalea sp. SE-J8]